jgi:hypothetical protein
LEKKKRISSKKRNPLKILTDNDETSDEEDQKVNDQVNQTFFCTSGYGEDSSQINDLLF